MKNLFTVAGALAALAILFTASFAGLASAQGTVMGAIDHTPPGIPTTVMVGQPYEVDLRDYLGSEFDPWFDNPGKTTYNIVGHSGDGGWLTLTGLSGDYPYTITGGHLLYSGTPTEAGAYTVSLQFAEGPVSMNTIKWRVTWTINVEPIPYTVKLISDPLPTEIETSAGTVTLTDGVGTILGGTVMQAPDLQRERQILHRWTDAAGNTYDWSKPVTSDLTLTADWRDHYSVVVEGNRATVTLSPSLPTEYTTHQINWGDNTVNSELTHLYAATGDYTITVRSGQWGTWASSSTTVNVGEVTVPAYTVTFNPAGGSAVPSQTVQEGGKATAPAAPTRQGYNFTGWYLSGKLYDFNTPVTGDLYLSAGWEAVAAGDDKDDDEPANNLLLILLTVLTVISLAITLLTRSPYALGLTVVLALIELALLMLGIFGVIA